jgi:hypothetical protein
MTLSPGRIQDSSQDDLTDEQFASASSLLSGLHASTVTLVDTCLPIDKKETDALLTESAISQEELQPISKEGTPVGWHEEEQEGVMAIVPGSIEELKQVLESHGIDASLYGKKRAKSLDQLLEEIYQGECQLVSVSTDIDSYLHRVVSLVSFRVRFGNSLLHEESQTFADGRKRHRGIFPSEKLMLREDRKAAVRRGMQEELGLGEDLYEVIPDSWSYAVETNESPSYPGLFSQYLISSVETELDEQSARLGELSMFGIFDGKIHNRTFDTKEWHGSDGYIIHHWEWKYASQDEKERMADTLDEYGETFTVSKEQFLLIVSNYSQELNSIGVDAEELIEFEDWFQSDRHDKNSAPSSNGEAFDHNWQLLKLMERITGPHGGNAPTVKDRVKLQKFTHAESTDRNLMLKSLQAIKQHWGRIRRKWHAS